MLYLPKIQTAEEAALCNEILGALERHLGLPDGLIKVCTCSSSRLRRPSS